MLTTGKSITKTMSITAGLALALTLTACGSEKADDATSGSTGTTPAATTTASPGGASDGSADEQWAGRFKKAIPPLADTPDADLVAAGKKMCADFTAAPTAPTAKAIIKDAETTLKLDPVQANLWTGGAIAHFCNDQGTAFLTASVG
ncbi:DUF732 domain-containing protein [Janibacter sp. HTCC2649]|uniref:DUF732 domain-containing protein n=1 Tax=Janibacter sp. HTCC2649 TaxID=313589 RepID=UPI000321F5D4|nr:DUF732 domain-containing protein [Janibacter sp. HTCC2649]